MGDKLDLYVGMHKGQRGRFFGIMMKAGTIDYDDRGSLDKLYHELIAFREHMRLHAFLEEKLIHPLLSERRARMFDSLGVSLSFTKLL